VSKCNKELNNIPVEVLNQGYKVKPSGNHVNERIEKNADFLGLRMGENSILENISAFPHKYTRGN
jgi:hypothetical protein